MKKAINIIFNNRITGNKLFRWTMYYFCMLGFSNGSLNFRIDASSRIPLVILSY